LRHFPHAYSFLDACVATLVLDIIPEFDQVVREMRRVTRPGGVVASGVFDFWGGFSASALVYDTASVLDDGIRALRNDVRAHPLVWANGQAAVWRRIGLVSVIEEPIVISFDYASLSGLLVQLFDRLDKDCPTSVDTAVHAAERNRGARSRRVSGRIAGRTTIVRNHRP
jgi:SAM-dependent methyltransferase